MSPLQRYGGIITVYSKNNTLSISRPTVVGGVFYC